MNDLERQGNWTPSDVLDDDGTDVDGDSVTENVHQTDRRPDGIGRNNDGKHEPVAMQEFNSIPREITYANYGQTKVINGSGLPLASTPFTSVVRVQGRGIAGIMAKGMREGGLPTTINIAPAVIQSVDPAGAVGITNVFVEMELIYGAGASKQVRVYPATKWQRVSITADVVEVGVRLRKRDTTAVDPLVQCEVRCFAADGSDGLPIVPSDWHGLTKTSGGLLLISAVPIRLLTLTAFMADAVVKATRFLLIFDVNSLTPAGLSLANLVDGGPLPAVGGAVKFPWTNTRAFVNGCAVATSNTVPINSDAGEGDEAWLTWEEAL